MQRKQEIGLGADYNEPAHSILYFNMFFLFFLLFVLLNRIV